MSESFTTTVSEAYLQSYGSDLSAFGVDPDSGWRLEFSAVDIMVVKETTTLNNGAGTFTLSPGLWVSYSQTKSFYVSSLSYITAEEVVQPLDEKYIPDTIARISDIEAMLGVIENGTY